MSPDLHLWSYLAVALLGAMSPGADFALVSRYASLYSRRAGIMGALGVGTGMAINTIAAIAGIGAVLAASEQLYFVVRLAGAVYLVYLGARVLLSLRGKDSGVAEDVKERTGDEQAKAARTAYKRGLVVNVLNPKVIVFLVALMPQFMPANPSLADQVALGVVTVTAVVVWFVAVAIAFSLLRSFFEKPNARKALNAVTGTVLIALGVRIAIG